jgi:hypothetical protein
MEEVMSEMRELRDTELDAVCGGFFNFGNTVTQTNAAQQVGAALGGTSFITFGNAGNAAVAQVLGQANFSHI